MEIEDNSNSDNESCPVKRVIISFRKFRIHTTIKQKIVEKLIQLRTHSKYFHTEICINNKWIYATRSKGVGIKQLNPDYNKFKHEWDYYILKFNDNSILTENQCKILDNFIKNQLGCKYDWIGILFSQLFPIGSQEKKEWFCSELVAKILQLLYIEEMFPYNPNMISPGLLYNILKDRLYGVTSLSLV